MHPLRSKSRRFLIPVAAAFIACGGCSDDPSGGGAPLGEEQQGIATYYNATGSGNCSYEPTGDLMVAAMNTPQYANSAACGQCVDITGPKGSVRVRIVDRCPECESGHLDLSREAFARIAEMQQGRVNITWTPVSCDVAGNIEYHFKNGSNPWWTAIQVRNHRLPIQKLEWRRGTGGWQDVPRESYNYFVNLSGMGDGPFSVRVTAVDGQQLEDTLDRVLDNRSAEGSGQFR
ncbi:expansin EXLX1 family cellulose-binding protein [Myxococcus sp. AB056]|uniref:expansin EXLX1 family cellulose-binding protein n=1 Tax=Myxococcus sp. AB056 TaxID=2562792 RepID=UPI001147249D|nr:expansin EXLX1 family cellulose-binding protein [Myxococcus sp. AB056]